MNIKLVFLNDFIVYYYYYTLFAIFGSSHFWMTLVPSFNSLTLKNNTAEKYRSVFPFPYFNALQSKIFDEVGRIFIMIGQLF